jgi:hypothetical protein
MLSTAFARFGAVFFAGAMLVRTLGESSLLVDSDIDRVRAGFRERVAKSSEIFRCRGGEMQIVRFNAAHIERLDDVRAKIFEIHARLVAIAVAVRG